MATEQDPMDIARERIAREAIERTGILVLQDPRLSVLPPEIQQLQHLAHLSVRGSKVRDIGLVATLPSLVRLDCSDTEVADLDALAAMDSLQSLDCSLTNVTDLMPLSALSSLQFLDCISTYVADLTPLAGLSALESVNCAFTNVTNLDPIAGLLALKDLNCSGTDVADLAALANIHSLQRIDCSFTRVVEITPILALPRIEVIAASWCNLLPPSPQAWLNPSLRRVEMCGGTLRGVPSEVLGLNCLAALRAHYADLEAAAEPIRDAKLLILGNGRAGKTQLVQRLRDQPFDSDWDSTHGIHVTSASVAAPDGSELARLHVWDFGGQDIYHGTHTLFTRSRALFVVVWARDTEHEEAYERDGIQFRNHPLAYWVSYVRHHGDANSPLLVVQTKCDKPEDEVRRFPVAAEAIESLPYFSELRFSAANDRGLPALTDALRDAILWLRDPSRQGDAMIGAGRLRVQRQLQTLRDEDAEQPPNQRRYRTLEQVKFRDMCETDGGISDADQFLAYLHNCGIVFYRPGLFNDRIILDQGWALDAIYTIFHRTKCYQHIRASSGRFTRLLLDATVWREYGVEEQRLFLSMMLSCGVAFVHRGRGPEDDETEYIAPDLLPPRESVERDLDERWDVNAPHEEIVFHYAFSHAGLMRSLTAHIGGLAKINALYWQDGVCAFEATTRSHALIEHQTLDGWRARLTLKTQGGQASELLGRLAAWIDEEQSRLGIQPTEVIGRDRLPQARAARIEADRISADEDQPAARPLEFTQAPTSKPEYFVSYAWRDNTPVGRRREEIVDQICERATQRGITIQRDKTCLTLGDSIERFMQRIGEGDRVFVVLSAKYMRSPYCMNELFEVWRTSKQAGDAFLKRIRVFALDDVRISTSVERIQYAKHWKSQADALAAEFQTNPGECGTAAYRELQLLQRFAAQTADILALIADIVQPRTIDDLERYGFDDPPTN